MEGRGGVKQRQLGGLLLMHCSGWVSSHALGLDASQSSVAGRARQSPPREAPCWVPPCLWTGHNDVHGTHVRVTDPVQSRDPHPLWQVLVDVFVNYDCSLQASNLFERSVKVWASGAGLGWERWDWCVAARRLPV